MSASIILAKKKIRRIFMRKLIEKIKRDMPALVDQLSKREVYGYDSSGNRKELTFEQMDKINELMTTLQRYNREIYVFGVIEEKYVNYLGEEETLEYYLYIPGDDFQFDRFRGKNYVVPAYAINTKTKVFGYMDLLVREDGGVLKRAS
jgi:hypothetical protein